MDNTSLSESAKRFRLSKEAFAKQRIAAVKTEIAKLRVTKPEVLSFCMFGSLTTGRSKPVSDIDGYLFVDADKAAEKRDVSSGEVIETTTDEYGSIETVFEENIANDYVSQLKEHLKHDLLLEDEQVKHIRSLPVNQEIIDSHVENLRQRVEDNVAYEKKLQQYVESGYNGACPDRPYSPMPSTILKAMFHLDVGGGIGKYRQYLIDKLSDMGGIGESIWKTVIEEGTEMMEQHLNTQTDVKYPRTLTEARELYVDTRNRPDMSKTRINA